MNINQLREALDLLERLGANIEAPTPTETLPQRLVLVRGDRSGVFYGRIVVENGQTVELTDARHVWSWIGALNVADLARVGPSGGKITAPISRIRVLDAIEVCDVSDEAKARFDGVASWKA